MSILIWTLTEMKGFEPWLLVEENESIAPFECIAIHLPHA